MIEMTLGSVRQLKGAPLAVVVTMLLVRERVSRQFLERATGYTDKPVSQALEYLRDLGYMDHTNAGWGLSSGVTIPLPAEEEKLSTGEDELSTSYPQILESYPQVVPLEAQNEAESRNNSDSALKLIKEVNLSLNINNTSLSRKNSDSADLLIEALCQAGIYGNIAAGLAKTLDGISAGQFRAAVCEMQRTAKNYTPGLLVHRIKTSPRSFGRVLQWGAERWLDWLRDQGIESNSLAWNLGIDYANPADAFELLPYGKLSSEDIENALWEQGDE